MHKQNTIKRYRGFNLLGMFISETSNTHKPTSGQHYISKGHFDEEEFKIMSDFGFDFARLPLSYRIWGSVDDPFKIDEEKLSKLDDAIEWGLKYNIHTSIAIHRAPGYCINPDEPVGEKLDLWTQQEAIDAFKEHWCAIAKRYKDVGSDKLTFNVVNEPNSKVTTSQYTNVIWQIVDAVREISPERTFMIDGMQWGDYPHLDTMILGPENCIYSTRGYRPTPLTHHKLDGNMNAPKPTWPGEFNITPEKSHYYDRSYMEKFYDMYAALSEIYKVGVICGEMGVGPHTPHDVALAWLEDILSVLKECNIGWALWNLCGMFGVFDSERADVDYEDCCGHKLDRKMMNILQKY